MCVKCGFIWSLKKILEVSSGHSYCQSPRLTSLKSSDSIAAMKGNGTKTVDEVTEMLNDWMAHLIERIGQKYPEMQHASRCTTGHRVTTRRLMSSLLSQFWGGSSE